MKYGEVTIELKGSLDRMDTIIDFIEELEKRVEDFEVDIGVIVEYDQSDLEPHHIQTLEERNDITSYDQLPLL